MVKELMSVALGGRKMIATDVMDDKALSKITWDVARRLRIMRRALDMSQAQICRETGISPGSWNNAETGDHRLSLDQALKVFHRFKQFDPTWLYLGHTGFMRQRFPEDTTEEYVERLKIADTVEALEKTFRR